MSPERISREKAITGEIVHFIDHLARSLYIILSGHGHTSRPHCQMLPCVACLLAEDASSFMACTYYKRYRMEVDLDQANGQAPWTRRHYRYIPWSPRLLAAHAKAKFMSFRDEIDAVVFPCLGEYAGCHRLMREISLREGFIPQATWLIVHESTREVCGTIQGVRADQGLGSIQNIGVVPAHRNLGLGAGLVQRALDGFRQSGLGRAYLEVTSDNIHAIRLYRRLGFREAQTVYKVAEIAYT